MKIRLAGMVFWVAALQAQTPPQADPFASLRFLEGAWNAVASGGVTGAAASGSYTFRRELDGHILARHSRTVACKGPDEFDCDHGDLLYVFSEGPGQPLKAIYFDSEGHVIHYNVSVPTPASAVFLSDEKQSGPRFRLVYELKEARLFGKFQMQIPGQAEWKSYLEWSGPRL